MDQENLAMQLMVFSGNAKRLAMEAISFAKKWDIEEANIKFDESEEAITMAHRHQTEILRTSFASDRTEEVIPNLLMTHAQDHMNNALTIMDISREIIDLYQVIKEIKEDKVHQ